MADILHQLPIKAPRQQVFTAISMPLGLDSRWTKRSSGDAVVGGQYELWFGPEYDWRAVVSRCVPETEFELEITRADDAWLGTRIGFELEEKAGVTEVRFHHSGWSEPTEHYRISAYCWALYLRLLGRYITKSEVVAYADRLDA